MHTSTCSISGLPIHQQHEWADVYCSDPFRCSYQIIGKHIIVFQGNGFADTDGEKKAVDFGNLVIADGIPAGQPYVMVQDWTRYRGASFKARKYFIEDLVNSDRLLAIIFCNSSPWQNLSIKLGRALHIISFSALIELDYPTAIQRALRILSEHNLIEWNDKQASTNLATLHIDRSPEKSGGAIKRLAMGWKRFFTCLKPNSPGKHQRYINELLDILEGIPWGSPQSDIRADIDPDHPLMPVFDAVLLTKAQLEAAFAQRDKIERDLRESKSKLEAHQHHLEDLVEQRTLALRQTNEKLQKEAKERKKVITDLEKALKEVKILQGILPICSHCKKIRDDKGCWNQIESYVRAHSDADFSHGICPDCVKALYPHLDVSSQNR